MQNIILPAIYTTWYNGATTPNNTIPSTGAIGVDPPQVGAYSTLNFDPNNTRVTEDIDKYIQFENRVLGLARLRQLRVLFLFIQLE